MRRTTMWDAKGTAETPMLQDAAHHACVASRAINKSATPFCPLERGPRGEILELLSQVRVQRQQRHGRRSLTHSSLVEATDAMIPT